MVRQGLRYFKHEPPIGADGPQVRCKSGQRQCSYRETVSSRDNCPLPRQFDTENKTSTMAAHLNRR